jgi:preprotein translocase subunit SecD
MNRYPLWKYLVIGVALLIGALYSLPNIFGEAPAVQVSAAKPTVKVELATQARVEKILADASIPITGMFFERTGNVGSVKVRFDSTDTQLLAKDLLQQKLNSDPNDPSFTVALNLLSNTPHWLSSINAMPMPLGLDLRGGVYFLAASRYARRGAEKSAGQLRVIFAVNCARRTFAIKALNVAMNPSPFNLAARKKQKKPRHC